MSIENKGKKVIMAVGDLHAPFMHKDAVAFLRWTKDKFKPDEVVLLGDELDAHAMSDYDSDPDGFSAGHELEAGIEQLQPIYKLFPRAKICVSNHTARPYRKAFKAGLPKAVLKEYKDILRAPNGWQWADKWEVDNIIFEHGEGVMGVNAAIKAAQGNMQSTVIGHVHSFAGIQYNANPKHLFFGMNVGCLIDPNAYAFAYGRVHKNKPIIGVGLINKGVPMFIPMILDKNGRWIGKSK
jgi:hypothetical protein